MRELTEGARLAGRYTLLGHAGSGGMAMLWRARDARSDAPVVLKFLADDLAGSTKQRELFHREWQIASRLMHPHIARVFEFHDDEAGPFYAQQFIDGPSIATLAGQSLEQLLRPIGLLADALRYAHGKQIVHSDLTAANVLLDRRGAPYLVDFGVAREAGENASGGGTPAAQSPQQRAGLPATAADDIYAFGVLLHELMFNQPPAAALPADTAGGERVPNAIAQLLGSMLDKEPAARPTAEAVAELLRAAGFPAGAAVLPASARAPAALPDRIEVRSMRSAQRARPSQPARDVAPRRGIPASFVAGGLLILFAALLVVLFVLPGAVEPDRPTVPAATTAPDRGDAVNDTATVETNDKALPAVITDDDMQDFNENLPAAGSSGSEQLKAATDEALGDLLSRLERLRYRGVERWGGDEYLAAMAVYAAGDKAYLARDYREAQKQYLDATARLEPFFDRIVPTFRETMAAAKAAFDAQNYRDAIRLYDLAVAITPGNAEAESGLLRARNLENVLALVARGRAFETNLDLAAARQAYESALELDPRWQPASDGLERVRAALEQSGFELRMTEGFTALAAGNYDVARAAFETARSMRPGSPQPADGLLQLDQALRLERIQSLEAAAQSQEQNEQWEAAVDSYKDALSVDPDLQFAKEGLQRASYRAGLHSRLQGYIDEPDTLSAPARMQSATQLLLELSRVAPAGPRLADQKEMLARLLKRAATPLTVEFRSDNQTEVSVYKVGPLGTFGERQLELRPGNYVAVGSRAGYRDVRLEFRVAPEIEMQPIVVQCEEAI